jgi:hypothetical protein
MGNILELLRIHRESQISFQLLNLREVIPYYSQQDATFLDLFIFTEALQVSGGSSAHH